MFYDRMSEQATSVFTRHLSLPSPNSKKYLSMDGMGKPLACLKIEFNTQAGSLGHLCQCCASGLQETTISCKAGAFPARVKVRAYLTLFCFSQAVSKNACKCIPLLLSSQDSVSPPLVDSG